MDLNLYLINEVTDKSEVEVLLEMTEMLLKECDIRYYMEMTSSSFNDVFMEVKVASRTKYTDPKKVNPELQQNENNQEAPSGGGDDPQTKPKPEKKGFLGFIKKAATTCVKWISNAAKNISDTVKNNLLKKSDTVLNKAAQFSENEQYKQSILNYIKTDEWVKDLTESGYKNVDINFIRTMMIGYFSTGVIFSRFGQSMNIAVDTLIQMVTRDKENSAFVGDQSNFWVKAFNDLKNIKPQKLTKEQFEASINELFGKLKNLKGFLNKEQKETTEELNKFTDEGNNDQDDQSGKSKSQEPNEKQTIIQRFRNRLQNHTKLNQFINKLEEDAKAIPAGIETVMNKFKKEQPQQGTETNVNVDPNASATDPTTATPPENGGTDPYDALNDTVQNKVNDLNQVSDELKNQNGDNGTQSQSQTITQTPTPVEEPTSQPANPTTVKSPNPAPAPVQAQGSNVTVTPQPVSTPQPPVQPQPSNPQVDFAIATDANTLDNYNPTGFFNVYYDEISDSYRFNQSDEQKSSTVLIDNKLYPNAYYYHNLANGQGLSGLQILKNVFEFRNLTANGQIASPLKSVIPAQVQQDSNFEYTLVKKGVLQF